MVESVLAAIRLLTLDRKIEHRSRELIQDYWQQKQQGSLSPTAQRVEEVLHYWYEDINTADIEEILTHLEQQPYLRDPHRLENLSGYLKLLKHDSEQIQISALEQIEKILLRVHAPIAIAWDFGGVLMDGHNKYFIELYAHSKEAELSQKQLTELWQTIFKSKPVPGKNYDALKIGQATPEQFASNAIANFNTAFTAVGTEPIEISAAEIRHFLTLYYSHYDARVENRQILHRISSLGIRQYGLTNNFMAKIEYFLKQQEFDYLQGLIAIVSEKFGASKPSPKIYLSFKQHVFIDRFAEDILNVTLSDRAIEQLWQDIFAQTVVNNATAYERQQISCEPSGTEAIAYYNKILQERGHAAVDVKVYGDKWFKYWAENYERLAQNTIFVDDKTKNLDRAFEYEEILGVHYDANQGQKIATQPVIRELLEQEQLKEVVRILRELTATENILGQRAKIALERLTPLRIRHEKLILLERVAEIGIAETLSDELLYALLQKHYNRLYETHFKLGQLVSQQYALIYRLAILPEFTYDKARWLVLRLFETSELFIEQSDTGKEAEVPSQLTDNLEQASESLLKKKLLPEIKRELANSIEVLELAHQPNIKELLARLQEAQNLEILKQLTEQLIEEINVSYWQQIEHKFNNLAKIDVEGDSNLKTAVQQLLTDFLPLKRLIVEWERDIDRLESSYFQQYYHWKTLKDELQEILYRDNLLDEVREFTAEALSKLVRELLLQVYDLPRWKDLTKPTMILVSGASGSGKSTLSTQIARIFGIQKVFSTDEAGRANAKAILDFLFDEEAETTFSGLYQSSFEGSLESYYYQAILTTIGVEGLAKRLHKQNTSALIEGVGLMPGLLSKQTFELLNIDWLIVQVETQQHWTHFERRAKKAAQRSAKRYQDNFEMIRILHDRIITMGLKQGLTIVENSGPIQQTIAIATERIKGPLSDRFVALPDPIRDGINKFLAHQRKHLPVKIRFDVKRAALSLGIAEDTIIQLIHRFGFVEVPHNPHLWIRQPLPDVKLN